MPDETFPSRHYPFATGVHSIDISIFIFEAQSGNDSVIVDDFRQIISFLPSLER